MRSQIAISSWGGRRHAPRAFTEQGVAMLSSVLRSKQAVQVKVAIMRTFVRLRQVLATNEELARKVAQHDREIEAYPMIPQPVVNLLEIG
ncbi:MAG: ORF6N domain-containing protein [bacterium]|nr:ORF6N domain-containing protein [bacterium]